MTPLEKLLEFVKCLDPKNYSISGNFDNTKTITIIDNNNKRRIEIEFNSEEGNIIWISSECNICDNYIREFMK